MEKEEYKISFFKPTTEQARKNRNLAVLLVSIWVVAIFGFQITLKIIEKPVPEEALHTFRAAWEKVEKGNAEQSDLQNLGQTMLQVMGKTTLKKEEYAALEDGVGWTLSKLIPDSALLVIEEKSQKINSLQEEISSLRNKEYINAKNEVIEMAAPFLKIEKNTLLAQLLSIGLDNDLPEISEKNKAQIPKVMNLYLVHNRSVLTDTVILGFPFHYFYTGVFLLILFVGLCWLYCYKTDKVHAKLNIVEQHD